MLGHGGDQGFLGFGGGGEFEVEAQEEVFEGEVVLGGQDDEVAGEAVTEIVVRDGSEAGLGLRAGGKLRVGAIGGALSVGRHRDSFRFVAFTNHGAGGRGERTHLGPPGVY